MKIVARDQQSMAVDDVCLPQPSAVPKAQDQQINIAIAKKIPPSCSAMAKAYADAERRELQFVKGDNVMRSDSTNDGPRNTT